MNAAVGANPFVSELAWSADSGALSFNGVRYLLIRPETLVQVLEATEAEAGQARAGELWYAGGFAGGQLSGQRYMQHFGLSAPEAVMRMCRMGAEIGWGDFRVEALDLQAGRLAVRVHNSVFAQAYLQSISGGEARNDARPHAVCHLIRGVLGGLMSGLLQAEVRTAETACAAAGAAACRFVVEAIT
jgi:uncharacterized protein